MLDGKTENWKLHSAGGPGLLDVGYGMTLLYVSTVLFSNHQHRLEEQSTFSSHITSTVPLSTDVQGSQLVKRGHIRLWRLKFLFTKGRG